MDEEEKAETGCAIILFFILPGTAGVWLLYGLGLALLSIPLWTIIGGIVASIGKKTETRK